MTDQQSATVWSCTGHIGDTQPKHPAILNVPGLGNSGPAHWQSRWEALYPSFSRAELGEWEHPQRQHWVDRLDAAIRRFDAPIIAAHSLGCTALAWWAAQHRPAYRQVVAAALLVAPADPEQVPGHPALAEFVPVPLVPLPFPSILVASRNDPFITFERAALLAHKWGSHLIDAGDAGHLNTESGLGDWALGVTLLNRLIDTVEVREGADQKLAASAQFHSTATQPEFSK